MDKRIVLGMDIGGTNLRLGLVDAQGALSHFSVSSTQEVLSCHNPVGKLIEHTRAYCERYLDGKMPDAVSAGFPSTIDKERRTVISTPNVKALQNLAVADLMEKELAVPVYVNRDVNFLMLYDMKRYDLGDSSIIMGVYAGTGIGNAISINGRLLLGKNGMAAELGHIPVFESEDVCGCGNHGCAETAVSGVFLEKVQRKHFPHTPIAALFDQHAYDPAILKFIKNLARVVAVEINILDPDHVILGGGLIQMKAFPRERLMREIRQHTRKPLPERTLSILFSDPGQENGVVGAGIYAFRRLESEEYL